MHGDPVAIARHGPGCTSSIWPLPLNPAIMIVVVAGKLCKFL